MIRIVVAQDYSDMSRRAAGMFLARLDGAASPLAVLPTGNTPRGFYAELRKAHEAGRADFTRLRVAQLDEYAGIGENDRRTFYGWLRREFLDPVGIGGDAVIRFDPAAADPEAEAARVDAAVEAAGGIDIQVFGLGVNGHVGFNEPGSGVDAPTRLVELAPASVTSNAEYWGDEADVPRYAYTLGLGTLARARATLLLVSGLAKSDILDATLNGPVTPAVPATILRRFRNVTLITDRDALAAARRQRGTSGTG